MTTQDDDQNNDQSLTNDASAPAGEVAPEASEATSIGPEEANDVAASAQDPGVAPAGPVARKNSTRVAKHTAEIHENQGKAANAPAPQAGESVVIETLDMRWARRMRDISDVMIEKERLQLIYVYGTVPKPYYRRWKVEANEAFSLMVNLKHRQAVARRRRAK